ncbi:MAG TPA: hypothetical protein PLR01_14195 [Bacteroidales bacterium]|nr:hypothetical protein [Bacteroidales bacterium]
MIFFLSEELSESFEKLPLFVMPVKTGIQTSYPRSLPSRSRGAENQFLYNWIPACAGMTKLNK